MIAQFVAFYFFAADHIHGIGLNDYMVRVMSTP